VLALLEVIFPRNSAKYTLLRVIDDFFLLIAAILESSKKFPLGMAEPHCCRQRKFTPRDLSREHALQLGHPNIFGQRFWSVIAFILLPDCVAKTLPILGYCPLNL